MLPTVKIAAKEKSENPLQKSGELFKQAGPLLVQEESEFATLLNLLILPTEIFHFANIRSVPCGKSEPTIIAGKRSLVISIVIIKA